MLFERPLWEVRLLSPELQAIFTPPDWNLLWGWFAGNAPEMEKLIYPGLVPLILTMVWAAIVRPKSPGWAGERQTCPGQKQALGRLGSRQHRFSSRRSIAVGVTGGFETTIAGVSDLGPQPLSPRPGFPPVAHLADPDGPETGEGPGPDLSGR